MVFQTWNLESRKKKRKSNSIVSFYIADVSCLTNRPFYMGTLSLKLAFDSSVRPGRKKHKQASFLNKTVK